MLNNSGGGRGVDVVMGILGGDVPPDSPNPQPRPQGFSLKKWVGREKALASAGHVSPRTS